MKKYIMALFAITLLTGCSTFFKSPQSAYDVGSKAAGVYVIGRPFIPQEERAVIREIYMLMRDTDSLTAITDEFIRNMVALKARDWDSATQQSIAALFIEARVDLLKFISDSATPESEKAIKDAFFKGVDDKLAIHNIAVERRAVEPSMVDKAEIVKLLQSME